jgi:hypothetical protein
MAFSLLLLAIVSISVVVAQTPPTCPAAPIWPITPAWASFTGDYTGYGDANNFGPAPLSDLTAVKAAVVDSTSPYAKAHGTQIYLSGVLNAVPTVVRVQGGDSFGPDSTNAAFTANWTGTQLRCLTVDQQTGEVYGLTDAYDIVHLVSDGTLATILTPETFSRLYLNLNDTATIPRIYTPVAIAIDASSNLFIAVDSYQKNPMISVLQPPANGQNATLTKITGSDYYNIGPYSRTYDPYYGATPSSLQFAHGYLHFFEYENGVVVRTQFPYSTFGSAADFDQNRLVVETPSNYDKNFAAAVIHDGTGTMFAITKSVLKCATRIDIASDRAVGLGSRSVRLAMMSVLTVGVVDCLSDLTVSSPSSRSPLWVASPSCRPRNRPAWPTRSSCSVCRARYRPSSRSTIRRIRRGCTR